MSATRGTIAMLAAVALSGCGLYFEDRDAPPDAAVNPPDAPAAFTPLLTSDPAIAEMALDATHLYWVDTGQEDGQANLRRMARSDGTVETLYSTSDRMYALALDDDYVCVVRTSDGDFAGSVVRIAKADATATTLATGFNPTSVAIDGGWVYYTEAASPVGAIWRVALAGGTPELVVGNVDGPWDLVAADGVVYYSAMNQGQIVRVEGSGENLTVLSEGWTATGWLTLDAEDLYFVAYASGVAPGRLQRVPREGGEVEQLDAAPGAGKLAAAGDVILWGDRVVTPAGLALDVVPIDSTPENQVFIDAVTGDIEDAYFAEFYSGDIYALD